MSFPALRSRSTAPGTTGAVARILAGVFGTGAPSGYVFGDVNPAPIAPGLYRYHEGDLFTPGSENFVFEALHELPIKAIWGGGSGVNQGVLYPVNCWPVFGPSPLQAHQVIPTAGLGGLQAGAFVQQPLLDDGQ